MITLTIKYEKIEIQRSRTHLFRKDNMMFYTSQKQEKEMSNRERKYTRDLGGYHECFDI